MRFHELTEKIANPPRNLKHYVVMRMREIDGLLEQLAQANSLEKKYSNQGEMLLRSFLRYGSDYDDAANNIDSMSYLATQGASDQYRLERYFPLSALRSALQSYSTYGSPFLTYVLSALRQIEPLPNHIIELIAILPTAEAGAREYGYDDTSDKDEEYVAAMELLKALRIVANVIAKSTTLFHSMEEKMSVVEQHSVAAITGKYRPTHNDVEVLYHASAFAAEIVRDGFDAERPIDRHGVGNFGTQDLISFTHDLKIAQDIVRSLREIWMIAHGQLTARQIIGWLTSEGVDVNDPKFIATVGLSKKDPDADPKWGQRLLPKPVHEINTPEETVKLYNVYLWRTRLRDNPVFTNLDDLIKLMKTREYKSIGIVACEVRLDGGDEYFVGEREFRVPPSKVLSVKRVL